jgi:hypothetical protein
VRKRLYDTAHTHASQIRRLAANEPVAGGESAAWMDVAALVIVLVVVVFTCAVVIGLFIWGAVKDGEEDKAVQARLGIQRRTRLGR